MNLFLYVLVIFINFNFVFTNNTAIEEFSKSNIKFTADLYKKLKTSSSKNIVFSPISLQICLTVTLEGARDITATELSTALRLPTKSTTRAAIKSLKLNLSKEKLTLKSANKLYIANEFDVLPEFLNVIKNTYRSNVENIDFSNANFAADIINLWVSEETNHTIKNLINPKHLDFLTTFVLINALYFKGEWNIPFKSTSTRLDKFYTAYNTFINVKFMNSVNNYLFFDSQELNAKFLEIGYKNSDLSMTFVLPYEREGLNIIENNIGLYLKRQDMTNERVVVSIPLFNANTHINFNGVLQNLGINELFKRKANLTGISNEPGLYVKYVIQKAFISVTEAGTTAAAATAVIGGIRIQAELPFPPPEFLFKADHPFLYYLRDNASGVILFIGRHVNEN